MAHRVSASVLVCIVLVAESALRGVDRCMCERVRVDVGAPGTIFLYLPYRATMWP